ncbi:MAG: EAL domain-containing protein, partial [Candidatus Paceibacterota bacterium]
DCLIISVNISPIQFIQPDFIDKLRKICKRLKVKDLSCLQFEITEGTLMNNLFVASEQLYALKELGANISIDDFGTGYSSLSYLKELPIDQLKIDQSFIRHCLTDERDRAIVATIISLARSLHLNVCAEGIEHSEQLGLLRGLSCDAGQGYLFSKPLAPDEFARHWKKGKATKVLK